MEIVLTDNCKSFTGTIFPGLGYAVRRAGDGFYSTRNSNGNVPPDGHLKFILLCAELTKMKLHIADILVPRKELVFALSDAGYDELAIYINLCRDLYPKLFNASQVLKLKEEYQL